MLPIGTRSFVPSKSLEKDDLNDPGPAQVAKITDIEPCDLLSEGGGMSMKDATPQMVMAGDYPEFEPNPVRHEMMDPGLTTDLAARLKKVPTDGNNLAS